MSKMDSTAFTRMKRWRDQLKAEGWKSYTVLLPAEQAYALDQCLAYTQASRRDTLTCTMTVGLEAAEQLAETEHTIANLKATVRRL